MNTNKHAFKKNADEINQQSKMVWVRLKIDENHSYFDSQIFHLLALLSNDANSEPSILDLAQRMALFQCHRSVAN